MARPISLYIHIPFCIRKCHYCDFLSFPATDDQKKEYLNLLCLEIQEKSKQFRLAEVTSIFFGGGTPSCLAGEAISKIMDVIRESFQVRKDAEITIEVNPGTVDQEKLSTYRSCGINRLSIGLQSTDDTLLKRIGRIHTMDDFLKTYAVARACGFENLNVDLMSALPGQHVEQLEETLRRVATLAPEHLSCYSLILEEGTPFYEQRELLDFPDEEEDRVMYEMTEQILETYGYVRYEISNYSKPGKECKHNIGYWTRGEYVGLGLGAASHIDNCRFNNPSEMDKYETMVSALTKDADCNTSLDRQYTEQFVALSVEEQMEEFMFLGLRLMKGIEEAVFQKTFGKSIDEVYGNVLDKLRGETLIKRQNGHIMLTKKGIDLSNYVFCDFLLS